ncbi:MAG TPA: hypothetical protein VM689_03805 [Aliidongia sp.]|nr:hypothetical protein [Aliidongia sp.]
MRNGISVALGLLALAAATTARAETAADRSCFARALPAEFRTERLDDIKLLVGWVFDIAAAGRKVMASEIVDRAAGLTDVPGFAGATNLSGLQGRYRVMRAPFDAGRGYLGVELGALDTDGQITSLILVNRLFRLPIVLQQPLGLLTDIATNGAMFGGWRTDALADAEAAAAQSLVDAETLRVPLLTAGQSQAGGEAQLQAAYLAATFPHRSVATGFVTLNAASVVASVRRLGLDPDLVGGTNFVKDLDPLFGPHGVLPNRMGFQTYIRPDGTGSAEPGNETAYAALLHPGQHLLSEFNHLSLADALAAALDASPDRCSRPG